MLLIASRDLEITNFSLYVAIRSETRGTSETDEFPMSNGLGYRNELMKRIIV
jgi:hypothetical protein